MLVVAFKDSAAVERAVTFATQNVLRNGDALTLLFIEARRSMLIHHISATEISSNVTFCLICSLVAAFALPGIISA